MSVTDLQREHLRELVVALRSGTYQQGQHRLCFDWGGWQSTILLSGLSLPDLRSGGLGKGPTGKGSIRTSITDTDTCVNTVVVGGDTDCNYLPHAVEQYFGLDRVGTLPRSVYGHRTLTMLNDKGYTFEQIADIIEEQFLS